MKFRTTPQKTEHSLTNNKTNSVKPTEYQLEELSAVIHAHTQHGSKLKAQLNQLEEEYHILSKLYHTFRSKRRSKK